MAIYPNMTLQMSLQSQFMPRPLMPDRFQLHANAIMSNQGFSNPAFPQVAGGMNAPYGGQGGMPSMMPDRFQMKANAILSSQGYANPAFPHVAGGMHAPYGGQGGSMMPDRFQMKANAILSSQGYANPAFPHVAGGMHAPYGSSAQAKMSPVLPDRFQSHAQSAISGHTVPCMQHYPSTVRR